MQSDQTDMIQLDEDILKPEVSELCKILVDILKRGKDVDPARLCALTPEQWKEFLVELV